MKDLYATLGVDKSADDNTLKKAYRKMAVKHHPDKGGDEQKFKDISEAYDILSDPNKRKTYDLGGYDALEGGGGMGDPFSVFESMFGSMGGMSEGMGMGGIPGVFMSGGNPFENMMGPNSRQQNNIKIDTNTNSMGSPSPTRSKKFSPRSPKKKEPVKKGELLVEIEVKF